MSIKTTYFLDTNVLIYAFTNQAPHKRQKARILMEEDRPWLISWQVVQEFCNVAIHNRHHPLPSGMVDSLLELLLSPRCRSAPSLQLWQQAHRIHRETQYRFYDSMIVAAAIEAGAATLYSEDLQHGRQFGPLTIINPFLESPGA